MPPAYAEQRKIERSRERVYAFAAVAVVELGLAMALLGGFRVDVGRVHESVEQLIDVQLARPPAPVVKQRPQQVERRAAAPPPRAANPGGSPGPAPNGQSVIAPLAAKPVPALAAGGGPGLGESRGNATAGGSGSSGSGEEAGGTDLEQIAGAILPSDYPRDLREAGIGGRVGILFTVGINGRVTRCTVTRSSGVPELDALTCRLIQQRFVYRPSTDSAGRPIADEVEGEHDWVAR